MGNFCSCFGETAAERRQAMLMAEQTLPQGANGILSPAPPQQRSSRLMAKPYGRIENLPPSENERTPEGWYAHMPSAAVGVLSPPGRNSSPGLQSPPSAFASSVGYANEWGALG